MWCTSSHVEECPVDDWNLYQHIERVEGLNLSGDGSMAAHIFKPFARKLDPSPFVLSCNDRLFVLKIRFRAPVNLRRLCIASCGDASGLTAQPACLQCFVGPGVENLDFDDLDDVKPDQVIELPANPHAEHSVACALKPFSQVSVVLLRFHGSLGDTPRARLSYVGLRGEHSHCTRGAVAARYEVVHAGHDVEAMDELDAGSDNMDVLSGKGDVDTEAPRL
eukprot:TRINITY_DN38503_c0_g1_i1.p1 TRINITY_DN38503_c0_g1~~TRINITY_DN38503_c0_g1_i1.p1  ORF type:complete len:221 (+),score=48.89 TRINITY_DN38503_c0_g1_i1:65-727(+)